MGPRWATARPVSAPGRPHVDIRSTPGPTPVDPPDRPRIAPDVLGDHRRRMAFRWAWGCVGEALFRNDAGADSRDAGRIWPATSATIALQLGSIPGRCVRKIRASSPDSQTGPKYCNICCERGCRGGATPASRRVPHLTSWFWGLSSPDGRAPGRIRGCGRAPPDFEYIGWTRGADGGGVWSPGAGLLLGDMLPAPTGGGASQARGVQDRVFSEA